MPVSKNIKVEDVVRACGYTTDRWAGNCHGVATAVVEKGLVPKGSRVVHGHWRGPVSPSCAISRWYQQHCLLGWVAHSWVVMPDGTVIDPTRWVFEDAYPYIYEGKRQGWFYDAGGNVWRKTIRSPAPRFEPGDRYFSLNSPLLADLKEVIQALLDTEEEEVTAKQLCWLANFSPDELHPYTKDYYVALQKMDLQAFVPIDNWKAIVEHGVTR